MRRLFIDSKWEVGPEAKDEAQKPLFRVENRHEQDLHTVGLMVGLALFNIFSEYLNRECINP